MLLRLITYIRNSINRVVWKAKPSLYTEFLRKKGVIVGENVHFAALGTSAQPLIDLTRPSLVEIGDNVYINENFTLFTHDYVSKNFVELYDEFLPSSGRVKIGSNVSFGAHVMVLKGVEIGDNCFIAAGSLVTKDIPANSIAAGRPAKAICTMEQYFLRRKGECVQEAFSYARSIKDRFNRNPEVSDFWEEFPLFVDSRNIDEYPELPIKSQLFSHYEKWIESHKAPFSGFDEFLKEALK